MSTTWILIASSARARIFQTHKSLLFNANGHAENNLELVDEFKHLESRMKNSDLVTDGAGNYHTGHGAFIEASEPKKVEADRFALELSQVLETGRIDHQYDDLVIIANPSFYGLLNKHLTSSIERKITHVIEKDYTRINGRALAEQIRDHW